MKLYIKIVVSVVMSLLALNYTSAQNLVPNGSFETYTACPTASSQIYHATPWTGPTCNSTEYYNNNNTCPLLTTLQARTGNGMAGFNPYDIPQQIPNQHIREYIQAPLISTLQAGKCYYAEFYVRATSYYRYAVNNIGIYFSNQLFSTSSASCNVLNYPVSILKFGNPVIADTLNWTRISGIYQANGTENNICIGIFTDNAHTDTAVIFYGNGGVSYYTVDDVSVISIDSISLPPHAGNDTTITLGDSAFIGRQLYGLRCNWYSNGNLIDTNISGIYVKPSVTTKYIVEQNLCGNITYDTVVVGVKTVGIRQFETNSEQVRVYPNPAKDKIQVEAKAVSEVKLFDILGNEILTTKEKEIDVSGLQNGIYFIQVKTKENISTKKIIVQH